MVHSMLAPASQAVHRAPHVHSPHLLLQMARGAQHGAQKETLDGVSGDTVDGAGDEAQAAIRQMVAAEQESLLRRIAALSEDINATQARVQHALQAAEQSMAALMGLQREVMESNTTAAMNRQNARTIELGVQDLNSSVANQEEGFHHLSGNISAINARMDAMREAGNLDKQVDDDRLVMKGIEPQLKEITHNTEGLEMRTAGGDLVKVVDESISKEVMDVIEDLGRGWSAIPSPWVSQ